MSENKHWTEEDIKNVVEKANKDNLQNVSLADSFGTTERNFIAIGMGDGGCNIISGISKAIPKAFTIAYNTVIESLDKTIASIKIYPEGKNGSGKDRQFSQDTFREASYKALLNNVQTAIASRKNVEFVLIVSTTAGGTGSGSSPMAANLIAQNVDIPVIIMGIYPAMDEDATAQYNAMSWQTELININYHNRMEGLAEIPYIILDNSDNMKASSTSVLSTHDTVNNQAVEIVKILSGDLFGDTNIQSIDNRDLRMLLDNFGGRLAIYGTVQRPAVGVSLDDMLLELMTKWNEPVPSSMSAFGLFVKGPEDLIRSTDTNLIKLQQSICSVNAKYNHLEISDEVYIAIICAGCNVPDSRMQLMKQRYEDIINSQRRQSMEVSSLMDGMDNPLGNRRTPRKRGNDFDLSALDF